MLQFFFFLDDRLAKLQLQFTTITIRIKQLELIPIKHFNALMFYLLWLKDIIPAILNNTTPKNVSDLKLLVNPIHVLDIALVLPGLIITAILLIRKHHVGFIFMPVFLVFIIILAIALIAMVIMLKIKGISDDTSIAGIFITLATISITLLSIFLKNIKKEKAN